MAGFTSGAIGGALSAGTGILGSVFGGKKKKKAAAAQARAIEEATNAGLNDYRSARDFTMDAYGPLATNLGADYAGLRTGILGGEFDPRNYDFEADPGYQFRMDEGQRALERTAAARGNLLSGAQMKQAMRYGQNYASNEYDRGYNRNANALAAVLGQREGLVGYGLQGTGAQAGAWNNYADMAAPFRMQGVLGTQASLMDKANASADMFGAITNGIGSAIGSLAGGFTGFGGTSGSGGTSYGASSTLPGGNYQGWY